MELPYDPNKWFSPRFALNFLAILRNMHGDNVLVGNKYKKEREAWIMGLVLLGINKKTGVLWWLQVPVEDPPDMRVMTLILNQEKNRNEMNHREIEIVEITKYTTDPIETEILKKLKNKAYTKETALIVYMNRTALIKDMNVIAQKLKGKVRVAEVWIVAATAPDSSKHILFSLFPDVEVIHFDIYEELAKIPEGDQIDVSIRAMGTTMKLLHNMPLTKFIP